MKKKSRVVVVATGVFDILHLGHLYYLEQSAKLGDELVVVIARDKTVEQRKGKPFNDELIRLKMVSALRCVDRALLGAEEREKHIEIIKKIKPAILTLGHDQAPIPIQLQQSLREQLGYPIEVIRIDNLEGNYTKTKKIVEAICIHHQYKKS